MATAAATGNAQNRRSTPRPSFRAVQARWAEVAEHIRGPARTGRDGIAEHFAAREEGADRLLAALDLVRADAAVDGELTFVRLEAWQRIVLGVAEAPWRTTSAWAKGGREWYRFRPDLPEAFGACLAEATDLDVPLPSRAARVYLDVAFFHPFAEGTRGRRRSRCTSCSPARVSCWSVRRLC